MKAMNVGRLKCVSSVPGTPGVPSVRRRFLPSWRELADEVVVGVHDPDVLFRIVGADLHVVRPAPDLVPLRPVFDHLAVAIEDHDDVLPSPIDARPAVAPIGCGLAAAGCGTGGFAHRQAAADGELDARPDLRKPGGPAPRPSEAPAARPSASRTHGRDSRGTHRWTATRSTPAWSGRLSANGFGHFCTGSYGPNTSCPPLSPGTAANPSPGVFFCCPWTMPSRLLTRMTATKAMQTAAIFSVRPFISVPPRLSNRERRPARMRVPRSTSRWTTWHDQPDVKLRQPYARHTFESTSRLERRL